MAESIGNYILTVDDEESICQLIRYSLEAEGYRVRTALNGKTALALMQQDLPKLVILDINMPGISGIDVLGEIRKAGHTPVIMLSVRNDAEAISQALEAGADDYISKPFENRELIKRVRTLIGEA